jgi:hypothetical protein
MEMDMSRKRSRSAFICLPVYRVPLEGRRAVRWRCAALSWSALGDVMRDEELWIDRMWLMKKV